MKIVSFYIAQDGTRFDDPLKCQDYERKCGFPVGTVGRAKIDLAEIGTHKYVNGILKIVLDASNQRSFHIYHTINVDDILVDYVNVESIDESKRWITATFEDVLNDLNRYNDDDLCEYEFLFSDDRSFLSSGCTRISNKELWNKLNNNK